jgi:hypothetical protein
MSDDFFVGYLPAPPSVRRFVRWVVAGLVLITVALGIMVGVLQQSYAHSSFEFGEYRGFEGTILERPYPLLIVPRPGVGYSAGTPFSSYLLVDQFKHGADEHVRGLAGRRVRLQAALIYRNEQTMLELKPGAIQILDSSSNTTDVVIRDLGPVTVTGEIVDTKCYLGVMNPGEGKVHRDCAARCISGRVPAAFVATDPGHRGLVYLLQSADGKQLPSQLLLHVGETITLHGQVLQLGDRAVLLVEK